VDEVNGKEEREVAGFKPTPDELLQLVRYWSKRILEDGWFTLCYGYRPSEGQSRAYAYSRIDQATAVVGKEAVDKAIEEVRNEFKAEIKDARLWDIFESGDSKQWEAVQD